MERGKEEGKAAGAGNRSKGGRAPTMRTRNGKRKELRTTEEGGNSAIDSKKM